MQRKRLYAQHHPVCYPSDADRALAFFRKYLPKGLQTNGAAKFRGIITPHIDFRVSLKAYAQAFEHLARQPLATTYVILGVGHRSPLPWNLDRRDYVTPLGPVSCDVELVDRLARGVPSKQVFGPEAHEGEHSIEFPLVWLQALHQLAGAGKDFRFVPLLCGGMHRYVEGEVEWDHLGHFHQLAATLGEMMAEQGDDLRIIVSIDGCHMGPRFGHPFLVDATILRDTAKWEERLWTQVAGGNARAFLDWMRGEGNERYFDGVGALALLLEAMAGRSSVRRTYYEQWFTQKDSSVVTFSSGTIADEAAG